MSTVDHRFVVLRRLEDLQSEMDMLRRSQERQWDLARLQFALGIHGLDVLSYDGPAHYELDRISQCEICGELVTTDDRGYELKLRSRAWGPRYGYVHQDCFERTVRDEDL